MNASHLKWKSFFIFRRWQKEGKNKKDCNEKPDLFWKLVLASAKTNFPKKDTPHFDFAQCRNFDFAQCKNEFYLRILFVYLCALTKIGVDWFRQQDQWVSKHAENRDAISLIPCHKILTGDQEFALAA